MIVPSPPPLILLPGLGVDGRMYREQKKAFPQLVVPDWIPPRSHEPIAEYAQRFIQHIDPGVPFYLGGASFGGILAGEMSRHRQPLALFLFASGRSPKRLTGWLQRLRSIAHMTQILPWDTASLVSELTLALPSRVIPFPVRALLKHLHHSETDFMRWGLPAVLRWKPTDLPTTFPIHHLHGERDPFFPAAKSNACEVVPGAGHLLTKTHYEVVNRFLAQRMAEKTAKPLANTPSES